jgi:hypothetical protein
MPGFLFTDGSLRKFLSPGINPSRLAPVSFVPDIAATLSTPFTGYPDGTGVRGTHVAAADPDIAMAVPAVIAADPDVIAMRAWRYRNDFDGARWRRSDADDDLCIRGTRREKDSSGSRE